MKELTMRYLGKDDWNRHTYADNNDRIWKFTDLKPREMCEKYDRLNAAYGFYGEPDCHIREDIKVNYIDVSEEERHAIKMRIMEKYGC